MPRHRFAFLISFISLFLFATLHPQEQAGIRGLSLHHKEVILQGNGTPGPYLLPDYYILTETETVTREGILLEREHDYDINYDAGEIIFHENVPQSILIRITYQRLPLGLKRTYLHRQRVRSEEPGRGTLQVPQETARGRPDLSDRSSLRIGGSKSLGISLGSDRDLSLEQSLRVNITGQIAKDIEVIALLSDQSSPLQPEGTTQTLEELDKVSIELRGKSLRAAFGDYTLAWQGTEFGRLERKLQGALGELTLPSGQVAVSGASSKGYFTTNRFTGIEGNQGPYQLQAKDGSVDIVVLAGTERVWIDGEPMTRGENNDYTIEYANGQITFTRHRLIIAESRIVVDFEYVDEAYRRSLYTTRGSLSLGQDQFRLGATFFHEADDRNDPLGLTLSDGDQAILAGAGDDGDSAFRYAEDGSTKVFLPLPRSHSLADLNLNLSAGILELGGEWSLSRYDRNTFSGLDDTDNVGEAFKITGGLKPLSLVLGEHKMGHVEATGFYRSLGKRFQPMGRTEVAEYDRRWNLPSDLSPETENVAEVNAVYRPSRASALALGLGRIERGAAFEASRKEIQSDVDVEGLPRIRYLFESIQSTDNSQADSIGLLESDWTRHRLRSEYTLWKLRPNIEIEGERKEDAHMGKIEDGFKFYEIESSLSTFERETLGLVTGLGFRKDWVFEGRWLEASESKTFRQAVTVKTWKALSTSAEYTHRRKYFLETGGNDQTTDLADLKISYTPFNRALFSNFRYQISSLQAAKKERQFIDVGEWRGNYRFDQVTGEYIYDPGTQDSRYLLQTKTVGDFEPIIELKSSLNLRVDPSKYFSEQQQQRSRLARWLAGVETETLIKIDEKSKAKDKWALYLFDLSAYQQDSTTIEGRITFRQDLFLLPRKKTCNLRFRYERSDEENNQLMSQGPSQISSEERLRTEKSVRLQSQLSRRFDVQGEFKVERNRRKLQDLITYDIHSGNVSADVGFRPQSTLELSLKTVYDRDIDRESEQHSTALSLTPGVSYSLLKRGRARADVSWTHVSVQQEDRPLYYTMAGGKKLGNNVDWSVNIDYRLHRYVTVLVSYTGRSEPQRPTVHSGRAEMRAFF